MRLTSTLPQPLPKECLKAAKIFQSFVDQSNNGLDGVIPREVLENAKGFAIFTVLKAGFVFSARAGSGIVIAKLDGRWSAPGAVGIAGVGLGSQAGAEMTDFLIVLNSRSAIQSFMAAGSLTLGGNMSIALGPLGRSTEASGAVNTNGKLASMYSYSRSRGLFGGVSIEGSVIVERADANVSAYNSPVTARILLGGHVEPPPWAAALIKTLDACTGLPGHRQWVNDTGTRTPSGSYIFGGLSSPGSQSSPSFFRKKKRDNTSFPPTSWGIEANTDSYFTDSAPRSHSRNISWNGTDATTPVNVEQKIDNPDFQNVASPSNHSVQLNPKSIKLSSKNPFSYVTSGTRNSKTIPSDHRRAYSLAYESTNRGITSEDIDNLHSSQRTAITKPTREQLTWPHLLDEGVARAIALFNFDAVEDGDLSFKRGDIIVVTKKSESVDDWWTGKIGGRRGIFPANFVELA